MRRTKRTEPTPNVVEPKEQKEPKTSEGKPRKRDAERVREETQVLPCALTTEELVDRGNQLALKRFDAAEHDAHAEAVKKELKAKETAIDAELSRLAGIVRAKREPREVRVEVWHDYQAGKRREVRVDTGEVVSERPLRNDELQGALPLVDRGDAAEESGGDAYGF